MKMETTENDKNAHPNALPNSEKAVIPDEKLVKYALDPNHVSSVQGRSSGKDKALVFERVLGFDQSNSEILKQRILDALPYHEAKLGMEDEYGRRYVVVLPIRGMNEQTANVLTAWIIRPNTDYPSLTTTYIAPRDESKL